MLIYSLTCLAHPSGRSGRVGQVLAAEDVSARIRSASDQAQSTGRTARPSALSIRSDGRAASGRLLEAARSSKRDPDGTETGGLERSLSVTGNFGAGSGSGALMKGSRFAADSMLEGTGLELPVTLLHGSAAGRSQPSASTFI